MTIPKRDKRKRRKGKGAKHLPFPPRDKMIQAPAVAKDIDWEKIQNGRGFDN